MEQNQDKKRASRRLNLILAVVLCAVVLLCLVLLWVQQSRKETGTVAKVWLDGQVVLTFDLGDYEESTLVDLEPVTGRTAKVELKDHQIRFVQVDCPDHVCEGYGFLSQVNQTAVCMPNRLVITVEEAP